MLSQYSGKSAYVDGVPCTQSWSLTDGVTANRYGASCVPGGTNTPKGVANWTGQITGVGHHPVNAIPTGIPATFKGVTNDDLGQGDLLSVDGMMVIEQITISVNKETFDPIGWVATFGLNGEPTETATSATDATLFNGLDGSLLDVRIGDPSPVSIESVSCAVRTATIVLRRPLGTWTKNGATHRVPGNLEADVSFGVYCPQLFNPAYAKNLLASTRIYISDVAYWQFRKLRFLGKSGIAVDRNTNEPIGYDVNAQWNGADAGVLGNIAFHDGTTPTTYFGTFS
jgi:hypothetical protein